jgi:hypothetical protein
MQTLPVTMSDFTIASISPLTCLFGLLISVILLTATHSFGSDKVKGKRERAAGAEDEKRRVQ